MDFIELLKIVLFGVVEGITEWLPISSTGHILLLDYFWTMNQSAAFKEIFTYFVQLGAILAVLLLFFKKLCPFRRAEKGNGLRSDRKTWILWGKVALASIPAAIAGVLLDDFIPDQPWIIATTLILYGVGFLFIERYDKRARPTRDVREISWKQALLIGGAQVLSIVPGTSRSGVTILAALLLGVSRPAGAEFTFFLAIPVMVGASLLKFLKFGFALTRYEFIYLFIGFFVAFLVSTACIKFLMNFVKKHDFAVFGWYRIALGAVVFAVLVIPSFF